MVLNWTYGQDLRAQVWLSAIQHLKQIHNISKDRVELLLIPTPRKGEAEIRARIAQDEGRSPTPPLTGRTRQKTDEEN